MAIEEVATGALNVFVIGFIIVIILAIVGVGAYMHFRRNLYNQYKCIVWERDGFGQLRMLFDDAGIFVDRKTNNKRFFMKKANVGLEPDNIPYLAGAGGKKYVFLTRHGLKNFRFIKPNVDNNGLVTLKVGEEDVNWAINSYEKQKKIFQQNTLLAYLPFIALAFVSLVILVLFIYLFRNFGALTDAATALRDAAVALQQAQTGTLVLPSG